MAEGDDDDDDDDDELGWVTSRITNGQQPPAEICCAKRTFIPPITRSDAMARLSGHSRPVDRASSIPESCSRKPAFGIARGRDRCTDAKASDSRIPRRNIMKASATDTDRDRPAKQCTRTRPRGMASASSMKANDGPRAGPRS